MSSIDRSSEKGFSLVEMVIASAIFAIAAAVAFILYTAAQKSFKSGQNFTDQQQNTRAAFDRVLSENGFEVSTAGDGWQQSPQ